MISSPSHRILRVLTSTALVLTIFGAARASAQTSTQPPLATSVVPEGHWTVTPYLGFGFSGDLDSATPAFGGAAGYAWNDRVALEGELNFLPSSEASGVIESGTKVWSLTGNMLYHFSGRHVVPYGVFGIGFGHASADVTAPITSGETSSTSFVVNIGGGVERSIANKLAVRGDVRYFFGGNLVPDYWRLSVGLNVDLGRQ